MPDSESSISGLTGESDDSKVRSAVEQLTANTKAMTRAIALIDQRLAEIEAKLDLLVTHTKKYWRYFHDRDRAVKSNLRANNQLTSRVPQFPVQINQDSAEESRTGPVTRSQTRKAAVAATG